MASSSKLSHAASASNTSTPAALPADVLFEVLVLLPAKDLCRLRAVCRSWRSVTHDPYFAAEHKSRHAEPLFAVAFRDGNRDDWGVAIVSLSGQVLRRIRIGSDCVDLLLTHLDRLFVIRERKPWMAASVLNPATGGVAIAGWVLNPVTFAFGQVASTGEYKVLRISHPPDRLRSQLCDIITLDGTSEGRWRRMQNPPSGLQKRETMECLAVNGVVYFFFDYAVMEPASIAPFDLDTEKWMPTLRGPEPLRSAEFGITFTSARLPKLANLNGSLVIIDNDVGVSFDLWFLVDPRSGIWVKKYRLSIKQFCGLVHPLLILDDGRIVIFKMIERLLQCYDPTTGNLADVLDVGAMELAESHSIGVYTGSLLI